MEIAQKDNNQKSTIDKILYVAIYVVLLFGLCITGGLLFHKYYYVTFYIDGQSMYPTLNKSGTETSSPLGNRIDFGIVDMHQNALDSIARFDIVTTYYPKDYDSNGNLLNSADREDGEDGEDHEPKIKRVIGLPGETVQTLAREIYIDGKELKIPYTPGSGNLAVTGPRTLLSDEYFVIGDNWGRSKDSTKSDVGPIKKIMIIGILIAIEGTCILHRDNRKPYADDFHYSWPTFYKR